MQFLNALEDLLRALFIKKTETKVFTSVFIPWFHTKEIDACVALKNAIQICFIKKMVVPLNPFVFVYECRNKSSFSAELFQWNKWEEDRKCGGGGKAAAHQHSLNPNQRTCNSIYFFPLLHWCWTNIKMQGHVLRLMRLHLGNRFWCMTSSGTLWIYLPYIYSI